MNLCLRCGRQEREPGLLMCRHCIERLVGGLSAAKFVPAWKRNLKARDMTDYGRAA